MDKRPWRRPRQPPSAARVIQPMRNPGLAAVLSFFICGLGQVYNGQFGKAIVFFVAFALCLLSMAIAIGFLLTPIMWLVGILDAYKSAEALNQR